MMFHENGLPADDSLEISFFICYFWKSGKIWNCRLLQIIGGALRVSCLAKYLFRSLTCPIKHMHLKKKKKEI